jgi:hypothetical protein
MKPIARVTRDAPIYGLWDDCWRALSRRTKDAVNRGLWMQLHHRLGQIRNQIGWMTDDTEEAE